MLKNPVMSAMSQMSGCAHHKPGAAFIRTQFAPIPSSENPWLLSVCLSVSLIKWGVWVSLDANSNMARCLGERFATRKLKAKASPCLVNYTIQLSTNHARVGSPDRSLAEFVSKSGNGSSTR